MNERFKGVEVPLAEVEKELGPQREWGRARSGMEKLLEEGKEIFVYSKKSGASLTFKATEDGMQISCHDLVVTISRFDWETLEVSTNGDSDEQLPDRQLPDRHCISCGHGWNRKQQGQGSICPGCHSRNVTSRI